MAKRSEFFTPESFVELARQRIIVRALREKTKRWDYTCIIAACCVGDTMTVRTTRRFGHNSTGAALNEARGYLRALEEFSGSTFDGIEPSFLFKKVDVLAAERNDSFPLQVVETSPAALRLLPVYGEALGEWNGRHVFNLGGQDLQEEFQRRYTAFIDRLVHEAMITLSVLVG